MRKFSAVVASVAAAATLVLFTATAASAAPADKPVVTVGALSVSSSGGVTPDSWQTHVFVPVGGYNFTPGGNVYITFQDVTAGTPALSNGEWTTAGTGPCGLECNNAGKISYARTLDYPYRSVCGHVLRTWAWDQVKSPQAGYGWSYRDVTVAC